MYEISNYKKKKSFKRKKVKLPDFPTHIAVPPPYVTSDRGCPHHYVSPTATGPYAVIGHERAEPEDESLRILQPLVTGTFALKPKRASSGSVHSDHRRLTIAPSFHPSLTRSPFTPKCVPRMT
jgi:hypothetical protein